MKSKLLKSLSIASTIALPTYYLCKKKEQEAPLQVTKSFKNRKDHLRQIQQNPNYDIVVIGGGCNGAGVLLDASTRGFKTLLIEKNDFGSGTSSKSTKLIHGGVRYLQQVFALSKDSLSSRWQKFKLVKEAIRERGFMIKNASYMNEKIPFIIPVESTFQSMYYYVGSIFYYMVYWFGSPKGTESFSFPYFLNRLQLKQFLPYISDKYRSGVVYEDGCFNDSRMLLMSLLTTTLSHQEHKFLPKHHVPSNILNKAQFLSFLKNQKGIIEGVEFRDRISGKTHRIKAKYVVNCTGAWADEVRKKDNPEVPKRICIVGGSHLTYQNKIGSPRFGLCLPSKDGRVVLVVPWLKRIIAGTTERKFDQPETNPTITYEERNFIQETLLDTFQKLSPVELIDLQVARWTGLRPLVMNISKGKQMNTKDIARNHVIEKSNSGLYSLLGGKWTTFRKMGEDLVDEIVKDEKKKGVDIYKQSITEKLLLVGSSNQSLKQSLIKQYGEIGKNLYKAYGLMSLNIINGDLTMLPGELTKAEIQHIVKNQMVTEVEDVVIRRTRTTFIHSKQVALQLIPHVAEILLKEQDGKIDKKKLNQIIEESMRNIMSYEFD